MKALRIDDVPKLIDMRYNEFSVMLDDGVLYHNIRAQAAGRMRNELASLIARTDVYGPAIIAGRGGDDVSSQYVDAYLT